MIKCTCAGQTELKALTPFCNITSNSRKQEDTLRVPAKLKQPTTISFLSICKSTTSCENVGMHSCSCLKSRLFMPRMVKHASNVHCSRVCVQYARHRSPELKQAIDIAKSTKAGGLP